VSDRNYNLLQAFSNFLMIRNLFIEQIIRGDRQAVEVFVTENQEQVFRTCLAYLQNEHNAADLAQEVFIKAIEKLHQYKGESKLSTWLIRIAINLSLNYLRDNKKRLLQVELNEKGSNLRNEESGYNSEVKKAVRHAIFKLPEKQRKVFILNFYLSLSYAEIADLSGYSISAVESLLFRARKNLRELLLDFYNEFID
jgi:RNA polymerase sigma factor (sigma-70 family)